jgi:Tfp pilus assembly protein PilV
MPLPRPRRARRSAGAPDGGAPATRRRQRGASLVEALIGFLVVATGMLAAAQWQVRLREASDLARQRTEAVRLARRALEDTRADLARAAPAAAGRDGGVVGGSATATDDVAGANTRYTVTREAREDQTDRHHAVRITVQWDDRRGTAQRLDLASLVPAQPPALALALGQSPWSREGGPVDGRHPAIPREARSLGDGRSVLRPVADGPVLWVLDDRSGRITARCRAAPGTTDLGECEVTDARLLSGRVRHARAAPPGPVDAARAHDRPLALQVRLELAHGGGTAPECLGEPVRLVTVDARQRTLAVPIDAAGPPGGADTGDRHWRYHCAVTPASAGPNRVPHWSGRLRIELPGARPGDPPAGWRVCRYSADTDGSGAVDRAAEATEVHDQVSEALPEQNYLVVDGRRGCPAAPASGRAEGALAWSSENPTTVEHRP